MAKSELIQGEIARFLKSSEPEVLCVNGEWGIGKTFLWQRELNKAIQSNSVGLKSYSYASLFGISSLEALKMAIFENSTPVTQSDNVVRKGVFAGWQIVKRNRGLATAAPFGVGKFLENAGPLYFSIVRNQIICVDDLERRGGNLSVGDVLGLISFLKEQRKCKIILLLNDQALPTADSAELSNYFEKVVDSNMRFNPDAVDSVRIALTGSDEISKQLGEKCVGLGISNIRVIKKIERVVREVIFTLAGYDPLVLSQAIQSLALLGWATWQPNLAPSLPYLKAKRGLDSVANKEATDPKAASWNALLEQYGFGYMDEFDWELLKVIENGYLDPVQISQKAIALDAKIKAARKDGSFENAWRAYHDSFADNQDDVLNSIYAAFRSSIQTITPMNFDATVRLFREFGRSEQAVEMFKFYLDNRVADADFWNLEGSSFGSEVQDPMIRAAFAEKFASLHTPTDPIDALVHLGTMDSWSNEIFGAVTRLSAADFVDIFKRVTGKKLRHVINGALKFDRISNATPEQREVTKRAKEALKAIGGESELNARRVSKYGITV
jgi:hypothetical protein